MATVNLGSIKFKWKGTYAGGTAYTIDDVVSYNGSSYICIQASTGNLPTDTAYFEQMSSAGTNGTDGTDLGTTLTTQGDIVYRDASGLQRLGAGTSGQVLQTGGTGANPSWETVSSDMVKLSLNAPTVNTTSITIDNVFTSAYNNYRVVMSVVNNSGTNDHPAIRFIDSSGSIISSFVYSNSGDQSYRNLSTDGTGQSGGWENGEFRCFENQVSDNGRMLSHDLYLYGVTNSNVRTRFFMLSGVFDGTYYRTVRQSGEINNISADRGIHLFAWNGNAMFSNGTKIVIYGMKE